MDIKRAASSLDGAALWNADRLVYRRDIFLFWVSGFIRDCHFSLKIKFEFSEVPYLVCIFQLHYQVSVHALAYHKYLRLKPEKWIIYSSGRLLER